MKYLKLLDKKFEFWICTILYIFIVVMIFIEVFSRYVLQFSYVWAEETAIYAFIWMSYVAMAKLARTRSHLAFTTIRDSVSEFGKLVMFLISDVALMTLSIVIVYNVYEPIYDNIFFDQRMMGVDLPLWIATAAVPFGWLLLALRIIQRAIQSISEFRAGERLSTVAAMVD